MALFSEVLPTRVFPKLNRGEWDSSRITLTRRLDSDLDLTLGTGNGPVLVCEFDDASLEFRLVNFEVHLTYPLSRETLLINLNLWSNPVFHLPSPRLPRAREESTAVVSAEVMAAKACGNILLQRAGLTGVMPWRI